MSLRGLRRALLVSVLFGAAAPACASASVGSGGRAVGSGGRVAGSRGRAVGSGGRAADRATAAMTGLAPAAVTSAELCPPVAAGVARCEAQALVLRADRRRFVRPRVERARMMRPRLRARTASATSAPPAAPQPDPGTPEYLQQAYDLSYLSATAGAGDTVAIVDAYDDPTAEQDLAVYRNEFGLPPCTSATGCFRKVNQTGAPAPLPQQDDVWESEISLDLDAVSALCPECRILLVEANSNLWSDLQPAVAEAAYLGADQISNSWAVDTRSIPSGTVTFAHVATVAATGDQGYVGWGYSSYPAAFAGVTAAGGTSLGPAGDGQDPRGFVETAWSAGNGNAAGSGCDLRVGKPVYQTDVGCSGRAYADLSADADPASGLIVFDSGQGGWTVLGGTSLATPLIAAYYAVTGVNSVTPQWAYADSALLNDPSSGSNGNCTIWYMCNAGPGYDGPTGVGSISGAVSSGAPGIGGPSGATGTYAIAVAPQTVTLEGGVYPNGLDTTYWWEYGTSTAYGLRTAATDAGLGHAPVPFTTDLTGLSPQTTYHYRLVAQNSLGTTYGYDLTVTTAPQPSSSATTPPPPPTAAQTQPAPAQTRAPSISGAPRRLFALTAAVGSWSPAPSAYSFRWQRGVRGTFHDIPAATGLLYRPVRADEHKDLRVLVTATDAVGSTTAASAAVGPVAADPPVLRSAPTLSGTARQGQWLSYQGPVWKLVTPDTSFSVQWKRCRGDGTGCVSIRGATGPRYRLSRADAGHRVIVVVTATNPDGTVRAGSRPSALVGRPAHAATR